MWRALSKVNRLQCVDSDRCLLYATNASRIYHEAACQGASYDYRTLRVSGRISSARVCVWVCASVLSFLCVCMCPKLSSHLFMSCKKKIERLFFPRAHERTLRHSSSSSLSHKKDERTDRPNAQGQRSLLKHTHTKKISVFGSRVFFGAVQLATSSASALLFITTCASVERRHYGPLKVCCHLVLSSDRKEPANRCGERRPCLEA